MDFGLNFSVKTEYQDTSSVTPSHHGSLTSGPQAPCNCIEKLTIISSSCVDRSSWIYGPRQANLVLIACARSEGSGEPAHPRSLARTSAARSYKQ